MSNLKDIKQENVPVQLGEKAYNLRFDLNAFAELEDEYGSVEKALKAMEDGSVKAIRSLIWAGILHEDESLTPKQVGALITLGNLEVIGDKLKTAMELAMPQNREQKRAKAKTDPNK